MTARTAARAFGSMRVLWGSLKIRCFSHTWPRRLRFMGLGEVFNQAEPEFIDVAILSFLTEFPEGVNSEEVKGSVLFRTNEELLSVLGHDGREGLKPLEGEMGDDVSVSLERSQELLWSLGHPIRKDEIH